jgi:hypothetical protein
MVDFGALVTFSEPPRMLKRSKLATFKLPL